MNCLESTDQEKISALMEKARAQNPDVYLAGLAVICAFDAPTAIGIDWLEGYTRSDFKRAVKLLRGTQKQAPQLTAIFEDAIKHIRAEWLHREAGAATYPGQLGGDAGPVPGSGRRQDQAAGENRGELVG